MRDVNISVPDEMVMYIKPRNKHDELERNALLLYPYINDNTISHGRAAEILGVSKYELIDIYDRLGLAYLSMDISEVEAEIESWDKMKGKM
jgi:helix-turn-helix protein